MEKTKAPVQTLENLEMKKTLVALAALAATSAFAQSTVTLSGNLDFAYGTAKTSTSASEATISTRDLTSSTSVIKISAVEDLGGGTKATVQYGIDPRKLARDQAAGFTSDETFIGLSGNMGNVRLGSANSLGLGAFGTSSPFGTGIGGGYAHNVVGYTSNIRYARSARYDSPAFAGLSVSVLKAEGADTVVASTSVVTASDIIVKAKDTVEFGVNYANGPLTVAYANVKHANYSTEKARSANTLGANYVLGTTTLYAGMTSGDLLSDTTAVATTKGNNVAVKHTMGKIDVMVGINNRKNSNAEKQKVTGLRADYNFSKTTATYVGYEDFKGATAAADQKIVSIGIRKSF